MRSAIRAQLHLNRDLHHIYPLFDTMYSTPSQLFTHDSTGNLSGVFISSEGSKQGCTEAAFLFSLAIQPILSLFEDNIVAFADDIFIIGTPQKCSEIEKAISILLANIGLKTNPSKTLHISASSSDLPLILGGMVFPNPTTQFTQMIHDITDKLVRIRAADISLQYKWLLTHHFSTTLSHLSTVSTSPHSLSYLSAINTLFSQHVIAIFGITSTQPILMQLFAPIARGGLGLTDLTIIHKLCREHPGRHDQENYDLITFTKWTDAMSPTDKNRILPLHLDKRQFSWVDMLPTHKRFILSDTEMQHAFEVRFDCLKPFPLLCGIAPITDQHTFLNHIMTCKPCASAGFSQRHEAILDGTCMACSIHHTQTTRNVDNLPIPGADTRCGRKSGPDALIYISPPIGLDVTCVHNSDTYTANNIDRFEDRNDQKHTTYKTWQLIAKMAVFPCTVSSYGRIHTEFLTLMLNAIGKRCLRTFSYHIQSALLKATSTSILLLKARALLVSHANPVQQPLTPLHIHDSPSDRGPN